MPFPADPHGSRMADKRIPLNHIEIPERMIGGAPISYEHEIDSMIPTRGMTLQRIYSLLASWADDHEVKSEDVRTLKAMKDLIDSILEKAHETEETQITSLRDARLPLSRFDEESLTGPTSKFERSKSYGVRLGKLMALEEDMDSTPNSALVLFRLLWEESWPVRVSFLLLILFQVFLWGLTQVWPWMHEKFAVNTQILATPAYFNMIDTCLATGCSLDDGDFHLMYTMVIAFVAILSGLGSELFFGYQLLTMSNQTMVQWTWIYANLLFPLFILVGCSARSSFGVILGIIGMYKFGFPETSAYLADGFKKDWRTLEAWPSLLNGFGLLFHHSASVMYMCGLNFSLYHPTKHLIAIPLPLCLQHATHILKYIAPWLYPFTQLILEIWFEAEILACYDAVTEKSMPYTGATMLVAHWFFWIGAFIDIYISMKSPQSEVNDNLDSMSEASFLDMFPRLKTFHSFGAQSATAIHPALQDFANSFRMQARRRTIRHQNFGMQHRKNSNSSRVDSLIEIHTEPISGSVLKPGELIKDVS